MPPGGERLAATSTALLATKLHAPALRRERVHRLELLERLRAPSHSALTLVAATPGSGKTTLLAEWCAGGGGDRRFAWLSLDPGDNEPVRFWAYVLEALRTAVPGFGSRAEALLRVPGASLLELVLPAVVNELDRVRGEVVLVLDDYHLITNREVHATISFLLEHRPRPLRLVISTRSDPPLPLARLRARGELGEIRAADLRFSENEAAALLNEVLELGLSADQVIRLQERTEGWAAGLHLAALSLRGRSNRGEFIEAFAGDDRYVVDYLGTEVLENQREEVREFLLRTSVLDRLCGPLCDAVTAREGSVGLLEEIERANLFLVPLGTRREWYRYHHVFGQLLRYELERVEPALVPELHRRASAWHLNHGSIVEAVHHAVAAGAVGDAGELVALHWNRVLNLGGVETVAGWLDALPPEALRDDPRLCLARAGTLLTLGRREQVESWLDAAEAGELRNGSRTGAASIEAEATIYRAVARYMLGDLERAREAALRAEELERDDASPWRAMACAALGRTLYWCGDLDRAAAALADAVQLEHPTANNLSVIGAIGYLATIRAEQGDLDEAERLAHAALERSDERGFSEHWVPMTALVARARALAQRGRLDEAEPAARRAVELARRGAGRVELADCLLALADLLRLRGDVEGARELAREVRPLVEACAAPGTLARFLERIERDLRPAARPGDPDELSDRELAVLRLLVTDLSLREIGTSLYVSLNTVKTHTRRIYRKLGASSRAEAVERARDAGLLGGAAATARSIASRA